MTPSFSSRFLVYVFVQENVRLGRGLRPRKESEHKVLQNAPFLRNNRPLRRRPRLMAAREGAKFLKWGCNNAGSLGQMLGMRKWAG